MRERVVRTLINRARQPDTWVVVYLQTSHSCRNFEVISPAPIAGDQRPSVQQSGSVLGNAGPIRMIASNRCGIMMGAGHIRSHCAPPGSPFAMPFQQRQPVGHLFRHSIANST